MSIWVNKPPLGSQVNFGHPLAQGLVGCWIMNEGGGLTVKDIAKNNNGTLTGNVTWKNSSKGKSLNFLGNNTTNVTIGNSATFNLSTLSIVVLFRVSALTTGWQGLVTRGTSSNGYAIFLDTSSQSGHISARINGVTLNSSFAPTLNSFYMSVLTCGNSNSLLYNNGLYLTSTGSVPNSTSEILYFGRDGWSANDYFKGDIAFVLIYNRALSPSEIQSLYVNPYQFISRPDIGADEYVAAAQGDVILTGVTYMES